MASYWGGDIPWATPSDVTTLTGKYFRQSRDRITHSGLASSGATLLPAGALLVTTRATLGAVAIAAVETATNQGFKSIVCVSDADANFYYHVFKGGVPDLARRASGTTFLEISASEFRRLLLPAPPFEEQGRIAKILDTVDEALENTTKLLVKLGRISQGLLTDLLTRGVTDSGNLRDSATAPDEFTETPNGLIPSSWRPSTLGSEFTLQRGFDITVDQQRAGEVPVVSSSGITSRHDTAMVSGPGVVTGRKGKLGDVYLVQGDFWPHDTTLWVKDFHGNDPAFAALFLRSLRLERFDAATSVPTLNRNFIHPLAVFIPPLADQRRIVMIMAAIEEVITREQHVLGKLLMLKHGLANVLLRGPIAGPSRVEAGFA